MNTKIIGFAIKAHADVNHFYDDYPYSVHLSIVASYAQKYIEYIAPQFRDDVISACWLHDTIEDCRMTYNDILKISNEHVAGIVYAVTNEKGRNRKERANSIYYEGIKSTPFATFVKLCDRLANVKYSVDTQSKMLNVYRKENDEFLESLIVNNAYLTMVNELKTLLK